MNALPTNDLNYILENTQPVWAEFNSARLFITGGTGFIGTWLLETLRWAIKHYQLNLSIVVLSRQNKQSDGAIQFIQGDVRNFNYPKIEFTHLIHAATEASAFINANEPKTMLATILNGTQHVLEFANQANVNKFLFLSSGAVYGKQPSHVTEDYQGAHDNLNVNAAYAIGKHTAEHLCALHAKESSIQIKIARLFAFVGPHLPLNKHYAMGNFIRDGLAGGPIQVQSDGTATRSYLYAADLVIWLLHILCFGQTLQPYNVGSDEAISISDLAYLVAAQFSPQPAVTIAMQPDETKPIERYIPNVARARCAFGLYHTIDLKSAIQKTIAYAKTQ